MSSSEEGYSSASSYFSSTDSNQSIAGAVVGILQFLDNDAQLELQAGGQQDIEMEQEPEQELEFDVSLDRTMIIERTIDPRTLEEEEEERNRTLSIERAIDQIPPEELNEAYCEEEPEDEDNMNSNWRTITEMVQNWPFEPSDMDE